MVLDNLKLKNNLTEVIRVPLLKLMLEILIKVKGNPKINTKQLEVKMLTEIHRASMKVFFKLLV